jgi:predicted permease
MRSADVFTWVGVISFIASFAVGRWWFAVGAALVVAVIVGATANSGLGPGPVFIGLFFGAAVGIVMLAGFLLRLSVIWSVGAVKELRARRK